MLKLALAFAALSCLAFVSDAAPRVIVDFKNTVPNGGVGAKVIGKDVDSPGRDVWNFDDVQPLFNGNVAGSNTRIFGGIDATWEGGADYNPTVHLLANGSGRMHIQNNPGAPNTTTVDTSLKAILLWKKEDFLNGGAAGAVQFYAGDTLSVGWTQVTTTRHDIRFVVRQGGRYYVSSPNFSNQVQNQPADKMITFTIEPSLVDWAPVDPQDYSIGTFGPLSLGNVEAVGIFMNTWRAGAQLVLSLVSFQAIATLPGS